MKKLLLAIVLLTFSSLPTFGDSVTVLGGYFMPEGGSDIYRQNETETDFETDDLNGFSGSFRYDHFLNDFVSIGGGMSFSESDTLVEDVDFEFSSGAPILRTISLQIIPLEANLHFLPAGRNSVIIPYVGGGVGAYFWEYEEFGDFIVDRFNRPSIITGSAYSDGTDFGWHVEGGIQVPVSHYMTITGEVKYFDVEGDLDVEGFDPAFEPIDLSATTISGGVSFWF